MLFIAMGAAYIIKVYEINKPASLTWVEQNLKLTLSQYISPSSVNDSVEFTISTLILWLCIYMSYRKGTSKVKLLITKGSNSRQGHFLVQK